jgi:hypothetical protein
MDSQFADTSPDRFNVTGVTKRQPIDSGCNFGSSAVITQFRHPVRKSGCFANLGHGRVYPMGYILSTFKLPAAFGAGDPGPIRARYFQAE